MNFVCSFISCLLGFCLGRLLVKREFEDYYNQKLKSVREVCNELLKKSGGKIEITSLSISKSKGCSRVVVSSPELKDFIRSEEK